MIRDEIKEQQQKMEGKSRKEKFQYFWYYYKVHVTVGILAIIGVIYLINTIVSGSREPSIYVALINSTIYTDEETTLLSDYVLSRGIDEKEHPAQLDYSMRIQYPATDNISIISAQQLTAHMNLGNVDVYVCEKQLIDEYAPLDAFENLEELLPDALLQEISDKLYYVQIDGKGRVPVAFFADEVSRIQEDEIYANDVTPLVAVGRTSQRKEAAADFIQYLFEE